MEYKNSGSYAFKFLVVLYIIFLTKLVNADCEWDEDDDRYDYNCGIHDLAAGVLAAIILGVTAFVIGVSVLICFLCACLCFSGRRGNTKGQIHSVSATIPNQNLPSGGPIYSNPQPYFLGAAQSESAVPYNAQPPAYPYATQTYQPHQSVENYPIQH